MSKTWQVYLIECSDSSFYTGITNNLEKRMNAHKTGKGSKYVKAKGFKQILATKNCSSKSEASKEEYAIKQLPKAEKLSYFNSSL